MHEQAALILQLKVFREFQFRHLRGRLYEHSLRDREVADLLGGRGIVQGDRQGDAHRCVASHHRMR
ncbi:unannotated protein [freshwater metagenome]|uniref:Unannotated protein n=1 Tax=freshwater metagenome TaxID=449393 RepID=A0A6J6ADA0_9ZZZZ